MHLIYLLLREVSVGRSLSVRGALPAMGVTCVEIVVHSDSGARASIEMNEEEERVAVGRKIHMQKGGNNRIQGAGMVFNRTARSPEHKRPIRQRFPVHAT